MKNRFSGIIKNALRKIQKLMDLNLCFGFEGLFNLF